MDVLPCDVLTLTIDLNNFRSNVKRPGPASAEHIHSHAPAPADAAYVNFNTSIMHIARKFLTVKKSMLPDAGKGLFTRTDIAKGDRIVEYKGRLERWVDVRDEDGYNGYLFRLSRTLAINALPYKRALGRFANDARGLAKVTGLRNNAEYNVYGDRCFIEAIRPIRKGEEILVDYGTEYWDLIRKIRREGG